MPSQKRAAVTELFKDLENSDTKVPRVQCLFCLSIASSKMVLDLKTHIEQCLSCPQVAQTKICGRTLQDNE